MNFPFVLFTIIAILSTAIPNQEDVSIGSDVNQDLLSNIAAAIGDKHRQAIEERIAEIEGRVRPMFAAMPQNENQKLSRTGVRYVLYRLFMQRGWSIRGLEPAGETWNSGSPTKIFHQHLPENVLQLFEEHLVGQGFSLREVAIFAATFKHLVRNERIERLRAAYRANSLQSGGSLNVKDAQQVLDTYMASTISGTNISTMTPVAVQELVQSMETMFPQWIKNRKFVQEIKQNVIQNGAVNFPNLKRVVEEVGDRLGPWTTIECMGRKHELMELEDRVEDRGTGRVRLSEFYRVALHDGKWHFGENTEYLRQLGALDETDPTNLRVIIPNWVNSISNCMDASEYYSVCCVNECEALLTQFEQQLQAPSATPTEIAAITAALPSETVLANRTLPTSLIRRLDEIAKTHNGRVPLYGRLFSQWMHHAYPRECPFPHVSGTTNPLRVTDWEKATGSEVTANEEEMLQHIDAAKARRSNSVEMVEDDGECAPWMEAEELLEPSWQTVQSFVAEDDSNQQKWIGISSIALFLLVISGVVKFAKPQKAAVACDDTCDGQVPVYFV